MESAHHIVRDVVVRKPSHVEDGIGQCKGQGARMVHGHQRIGWIVGSNELRGGEGRRHQGAFLELRLRHTLARECLGQARAAR